MNKKIFSFILLVTLVLGAIYFGTRKPTANIVANRYMLPTEFVGRDWHEETSTQGLIYSAPEKVTVPYCNEGDKKPHPGETALIFSENLSGSEVWFRPEKMFNQQTCEQLAPLDIPGNSFGRVIYVASVSNEKSVSTYLNNLLKTDCIKGVTFTDSKYNGTLQGEIQTIDINSPDYSPCMNYGHRIIYSPTKQKVAFMSLGQDWVQYEEDIAKSLHF